MSATIASATVMPDASYLRVRINGETTGYSNETASGGTNTFGEPTFYVSNEQDNSQAGAIAVIDFYDYANTTSWKMVRAWGFNPSASSPSTNYYTRGGNLAHNTTSAITELNISYFGGNMSSGTAYLYGVK